MKFKLCVSLRQSPTIINFDFDTQKAAQRYMDQIAEAIRKAGDPNAELTPEDEWTAVLDDAGRFSRIMLEEVGLVMVMDVERATRAAIAEQQAAQRLQMQLGAGGGIAMPTGLGMRN